jgi:hypothetical protein
MLWELLATIIAGVGAAGIALLLRKLTSQRLPKYWVPVFAGLGMLTFQIHGEYNWFEHQQNLLPENVVVVRTVESTSWWRPWSYLKPHTLQFVAMDHKNTSSHQHNPDLKLVDLYFFEHRQPARRLKQVVHCALQKRVLYSDTLPLPKPGESVDAQWQPLAADDKLLLELCKPGRSD